MAPLAVWTTWRFVRIQPAGSKMIPEPTPCSGIVPPSGSVVVPVSVIRTTAGLTLLAASMIAEDSSTATGTLLAEIFAGAAAGVLRAPIAPVPSSTRTVPPEASTADRTATPTSAPTPDRPSSWEPVWITGGVGIGGAPSVSGDAEAAVGSGQLPPLQPGRAQSWR